MNRDETFWVSDKLPDNHYKSVKMAAKVEKKLKLANMCLKL